MSEAPSLAEQLVGVWKLVDARSTAVETGVSQSAYGADASGVIHYTKGGRMTALITHGGRERMDGDRQSSPDDQKVRAYSSSIAYAGTYTIERDCVRHHVEISTFHNWVGTDLVRIVELRNGNVVLKTAPQPQNGVLSIIELEWTRCE